VPEGQLSEYRFNFKPSRVSERPQCEECALEMWLLDIKPAEQGRDIRTYECARCGASKSVLSDA
jgi:hypothetical protein